MKIKFEVDTDKPKDVKEALDYLQALEDQSMLEEGESEGEEVEDEYTEDTLEEEPQEEEYEEEPQPQEEEEYEVEQQPQEPMIERKPVKTKIAPKIKPVVVQKPTTKPKKTEPVELKEEDFEDDIEVLDDDE